ncbi:methyltransferase [Streptomyces sp. NPDC059009]|uniref:methyltransferase n=1 Tax=Streptomyces sp. NPDC059009 TaxID=3346694 RepID=UPI00367B892D
MPLVPDPEELRRYTDTNEAPAAYLDFIGAVSFRAAGAAFRLGVFEELHAGPLGATELAARTATDERGLTVLLDALVSFGYLTRHEGGYANTAATDTWLRRDAPDDYASAFSFWQAVIGDLWTDLEESVRKGRRAVDFYSWIEQRPDTLRQFQTMLTGLADSLKDDVVDLVPVPADATRLLDIGGGHARYALAFCRRHPRLHATLVDLPGALAIGAEAIARARLQGRFTLREGDWLSADFGTGHDVALLFNVLHGNGAEESRALLRATASAVAPGGTVALLEPLPDVDRAAGRLGEAHVRLFSLNLFHTQGGRTYGFEEYAEWLAEAGFVRPRRQVLASAPTECVIVATRAGP